MISGLTLQFPQFGGLRRDRAGLPWFVDGYPTRVAGVVHRMNAKTRHSLLGYGLTVELVDRIAALGHTVVLLRAMGKERLTAAYGPADAELIVDRLRRKPIESDVVEALVAEADGCCCFCADGNSARPYEVHHIEEYADTQDNSKDNLASAGDPPALPGRQ